MEEKQELKIEFLSVFQDRYQRNNKRTGQKNLRCFPGCGELGHMVSGFCGLPVICKLSGLEIFREGKLSPIRAWGEFIVRGTDEEWKLGSEYKLDDLKDKERSRTSPLKPWLRGDISNAKLHRVQNDETTEGEKNSITVLFNQELLGWHYHWVSTKHTCDSYHSFKIHVFLEGKGNQLTYLGSSLSPQFQLYSRRRQRGTKTKAEKNTNDATLSRKRKLSEHMQGNTATSGYSIPGINTAINLTSAAVSGLSSLLPTGSSLGLGSNSVGYFVPNPLNQQSINRQLFTSFFVQSPMKPVPADTSKINLCNFLDLASQQQNSEPQRHPSIKPAKIFNDLRLQGQMNELIRSEVMDKSSDCVKATIDPGVVPSGKTFEDIQRLTLTMSRLMMFLVHYGGAGGMGAGIGMAGRMVQQAARQANVEGDDSHLRIKEILSDMSFSPAMVPDNDSVNFRRFRMKNDMGETMQSNLKKSEQSPTEMLKEAVIKHGSNEAKQSLNRALSVLNEFSKFLVSEHQLSEDLSEYFNAWSSEEGLVRLMNEMKQEDKLQLVNPMVDLDAVWHAQMIKVFAKGEKDASAFAQLRVIFFKNVKKFLDSKNVVPAFFDEYMEIAAKTRILPVDPFVPPTPIAAYYAHLQIYGNADKLKSQDFGSAKGIFESPEQQCIWARAVFIIKRRLVRLAIINRVKQEHLYKKHLNGMKVTPPPPEVDFTGTWLRAEDDKELPIMIVENIIKQLGGLPVGKFFSQITTSMFKRIKIKMTSEYCEIQGVAKLLANGKNIIFLDGKPREWTPPTPMPIKPPLQDRQVIAWIDTNGKEGTIKAVAGGRISKMARGLFAFVDLPNARPEHGRAVKRSARAGKDIHVRITITAKKGSDNTTLIVAVSLFIFPENIVAPELTKEAMLKYFEPDEVISKYPSHYMTRDKTFFRILDDSDRVEELLKLIEED